ncbi:cupin domain-containing protein [Zhengella sp. ZM62]|uniref:(R)-mandelonitrile lyase n=1 Tax=Zhengella sedimenti TaxID=3390035 RepID=UPI0039768E12
MPITISAMQPTRRGPEDYFTGDVLLQPVIQSPEPAALNGSIVTFAPGARTAWHTHPKGQTLHVLSGEGLVQEEGGPARLIRAGDTVWIPENLRHWHGATAERAMVHMAIQGEVNGSAVAWAEQVTPEDYAAAQPGH